MNVPITKRGIVSVQIAKRYFNVSEYYRMAEAGILTEDDRVELIEGEIVEMGPIGSHHAGCVNRLNTLLSRQVGRTAIVSVQNPIGIDDYSEPEPDIALLKPRGDFYSQKHPMPDDVLLVIEVADTSVEYDRKVKLPIYAQAGIPEAWMINLPKNIIEIYTQPTNGKYQKSRRLKRGDSLASQTIINVTLSVSDILG